MNECVLCGSESYRVLYKLGGTEILECSSCHLVKTGKVKVDYSHYHRDEDYHKFESHFKNIFKKRFDLVNNYKKSGKVLDIGCATGTLLSIFKNAGWEVWGVEPSKSAKFAKERGISVVQNTFEKAKLNANHFDVVILNHTLEHVDNPFDTVLKAHTILKKGGIILIDVPNFGSLSASFYKSKWPYLLPQEHTFHFTPNTLKALIEKAGFKVVHIETRSGLYDYSNPVAEIFEALFTLKKRFFKDVLGLPGAFVSTSIGMGTSLTIIAKK